MNQIRHNNNGSNWAKPHAVEHYTKKRSYFPTPPLELVGYTSDMATVHNRPNSHLHLPRKLLEEALSQVASNGAPFIKQLVDFGRIIGCSTCVPTNESDEIIFAARPGRRGLTRFVRDREPRPCSGVVVILKKREDTPKGYIVVTAFVGGLPEPEPWDQYATAASRQFWANNALVYDPAIIIRGTEQQHCPW